MDEYNQALEDVKNALVSKAQTIRTDWHYDPLMVEWDRIRETLDELEKDNVESTEED